jgi:hypothetical protein
MRKWHFLVESVNFTDLSLLTDMSGLPVPGIGSVSPAGSIALVVADCAPAPDMFGTNCTETPSRR